MHTTFANSQYIILSTGTSTRTHIHLSIHIWHTYIHTYTHIHASYNANLIVSLYRQVSTGYGSDASPGQTVLVAAEAVVEDYVRTLHYASGFIPCHLRIYASMHICIRFESSVRMRLRRPIPLLLIDDYYLSLIHIWRCRRIERCRSRWSPYH